MNRLSKLVYVTAESIRKGQEFGIGSTLFFCLYSVCSIDNHILAGFSRMQDEGKTHAIAFSFCVAENLITLKSNSVKKKRKKDILTETLTFFNKSINSKVKSVLMN